MFSPDPQVIDKTIKDLQCSEKKFVIDYQEDADFLGIEVSRLEDDLIKLSQPHHINLILKDLHFQENTHKKVTPALSSKLLNPDVDGE